MSLFGAIQGSANALRTNQLGLQVVGNNIANANTPGYIRQELVQAPAAGYHFGSTILGQGVEVIGVQQKVDEFVLHQMREVQSQLAQSEGLQAANSQVETAIAELGDKDISTAMSRFSNAMQDVANQPGNVSMRTLAVQRGTELALGLNRISSKVTSVAKSANDEIDGVASDINRLSTSIANLNRRIVEMEGGRTSNSDAVGLRDERIKALDELSTLVDTQTIEQKNGSITVIVGGDYLVADGLSREVGVSRVGPSNDSHKEVHIVDTDAPLIVSGGKLKGLYDARDGASATFLKGLDSFAKSLINEVNRIHSQGQGATGLTEAIGEPIIKDASVPIEQAGKNLDIENGTFVLQIQDATTGQNRSFDIHVRQNGQSDDTTLSDLITQINGASGVQASLTNDGRLQIKSASAAIRFSFSNDTSGALAALGINTFYSGDSASTIAVRNEIVSDPTKLAISTQGPGKGTENAIKLAEVFDKASSRLNGTSLTDSYQSLVTSTTQTINSQQSVTDGLRNFYQTLEAKHLGISGVSLDEEGIKMLLYQRAFQASSRVIATANELLQTLVQMV